MKEMIKRLLFRLGLLNLVRRLNPANARSSIQNKRKQDAVLAAKERFSPEIFIETGTYLGDMVYAVKDHFKHIYSIELSTELYQNAVKRFSNDSRITILNGDSGKLLPEILATINEPILFWLDAHYSEGITAKGDLETPIAKELEVIFAHPIKRHIIMIDDARLFIGENSYPTLATVRDQVSRQGGYMLDVKDDIIRIFPAIA